MTELILGTAQFGNGYGVTNHSQRLDDHLVRDILSLAVEEGIRTFDTAQAYDDSMDRLRTLMPASARPGFISKVALGGDAGVDRALRDALTRLGVTSLDGLLLHRVSDLSSRSVSDDLDRLRDARRNGEVDRVGVSVYDVDDVLLSMDAFPDLDLLQIPGSVVDRRLLDHQVIGELRSSGVAIHVRSAFLQGLLLVQPHDLPAHAGALGPVLRSLDEDAGREGLARLDILLGALRSHPNVDAVVVGVTRTEELGAIVTSWKSAFPAGWEWHSDADISTGILDPRRWT